MAADNDVSARQAPKPGDRLPSSDGADRPALPVTADRSFHQTPAGRSHALVSALQRTAGNRAAQTFVSGERSRVGQGAVPRRIDRTPQATKVSLPVPLDSVAAVRTRLDARHKSLNQFLTDSKQDITNIRTHFGFVNGVYKRSFDNHAMVIAQAKAQAETKQAWVDFAFGVAVGVSVGMMGEALIAGRLAESAFELVAEVGAEMVEGGIASRVKPEVPKFELLPDAAPELKQIRSLQILDDLNVVVIEMAVPGASVFTQPLVQCERVTAELRLIASGADEKHRKMTDDQIREQFAKITKFDQASAQADAKLAASKAAFDKLRAQFFARPPITDAKVEQDIWISWIAAQAIDTFFAPTLFNSLIRQHFRDIGLSGRLGVEGLGNYDRLFGEYWPHNPGTPQERAVVASYTALKNAAAAEGKAIPAFWNKVFLQA